MYQNTFKKIADLTNINAHTEAYIEGCNFLNTIEPCIADYIKGELEKIQYESERNGHIPYYLYEQRYNLYQKMMELAKKKLLPKYYTQFYNCF